MMYRHETGFGCAMWMMLDDVLRISVTTEPTTSGGTQSASCTVVVSGLPMSQRGRDHVQTGNLEGT